MCPIQENWRFFMPARAANMRQGFHIQKIIETLKINSFSVKICKYLYSTPKNNRQKGYLEFRLV